MPNPQGDHIWYELMTTDPEAARRFYRDVAGLDIAAEASGHTDMDYRMIEAPDGFMGGMLVLTDEMVQGGASPGWLGYIGVEDVDASVAALQRAGGSVHMPPNTLEGVGRMAMVSDPQGAHFYLMRGASDEESKVFRMMEPGHVAWNELATPDPDAAWSFYSELLGWAETEVMDMPELGPYRMFALDDGPIGGMFKPPGDAQGVPPSWLYYVYVRDIDASARAVTAGGGEILTGPDEIPGGDYTVIARDPQGAAFGLVGPRPGDA